MPPNTIIFQLAAHYLPKIALRLERLFIAIKTACTEANPIIHHYALKNVIEIIKVIEKPELKGRFIKELMRIEHLSTKSQPEISNERYARLFVQVQVLNHIAGRFGERIHQDPFLQSIRIAQSSHNMDCELHAPQLLLWLENDHELRQEDLHRWLQELQVLYDTVTIYLSLLRDNAAFQTINMSHGFYQHFLSSKSSCQLILVRMEKKSGIVPQIQLGHHGISVRLCDTKSMQELNDIDTCIELALCQL
jgi:cell division protein ZapD